MEMYSATAEFPLMAIPFATSIVLVMGSPEAEPAQPRALIGGHLISTAVGLVAVKLRGPGAVGRRRWRSGSRWSRCTSPGRFIRRPASTRWWSWSTACRCSFLIAPVGAGALLLAVFAFAWHNLVGRGAPGRGGPRMAGALVVTATISEPRRLPHPMPAGSGSSVQPPWWNASSVERWPIDTMVVPGSRSCSSR